MCCHKSFVTRTKTADKFSLGQMTKTLLPSTFNPLPSDVWPPLELNSKLFRDFFKIRGRFKASLDFDISTETLFSIFSPTAFNSIPNPVCKVHKVNIKTKKILDACWNAFLFAWHYHNKNACKPKFHLDWHGTTGHRGNAFWLRKIRHAKQVLSYWTCRIPSLSNSLVPTLHVFAVLYSGHVCPEHKLLN